jgi:hypothetical protein
MTQPLDPHTLRQAAARWPRQTLGPRAAQSFLHALADEAAGQPATVPYDPDDVSTWWRCPHCGTFPETADGGAAYPGQVVCALHRSALDGERGQTCTGSGQLAVRR